MFLLMNTEGNLLSISVSTRSATFSPETSWKWGPLNSSSEQVDGTFPMAKWHQLGDMFSLKYQSGRKDLKWHFFKCLVSLMLVMFGCGACLSYDLVWKRSLEQSRGRWHQQYREWRERKPLSMPWTAVLSAWNSLDFFAFLLETGWHCHDFSLNSARSYALLSRQQKLYYLLVGYCWLREQYEHRVYRSDFISESNFLLSGFLGPESSPSSN